MAKENSQLGSNPDLTAVYVALALLAVWVVYLAMDHRRMHRQLSQESICKVASQCALAPAATTNSSTSQQQPQSGPVVAPITTAGRFSADGAPSLTHNYFSDCYNYQNGRGNQNGIASYIQNEIAVRGNLPFQYSEASGCSGAGCPHSADACYAFWQQYAAAQATAGM